MGSEESEQKGDYENLLKNNGLIVVGVDEVGRGCLAGPVLAGAIILDYQKLSLLPQKTLLLIRDSKKLSSEQRQKIISTIDSVAASSGLAEASEREIEKFGIVEATFLAMRRAIDICISGYIENFCDADGPSLPSSSFKVLVDGRDKVTSLTYSQEALIKGDSRVYAISAASILAKEARDLKMSLLCQTYPGYDFAGHVGYGTRAHLDSIERLGPCPIHRRNFAPIKFMTSSI